MAICHAELPSPQGGPNRAAPSRGQTEQVQCRGGAVRDEEGKPSAQVALDAPRVEAQLRRGRTPHDEEAVLLKAMLPELLLLLLLPCEAFIDAGAAAAV